MGEPTGAGARGSFGKDPAGRRQEGSCDNGLTEARGSGKSSKEAAGDGVRGSAGAEGDQAETGPNFPGLGKGATEGAGAEGGWDAHFQHAWGRRSSGINAWRLIRKLRQKSNGQGSVASVQVVTRTWMC